MITGLEKLFKKRRDEFKKVVDEKNDFDRNLAKLPALISILGINSELSAIQSKYEKSAPKEYDEVADNFNDASTALSKTLTKLAGNNQSKTEEK